MVNTGFVSPGEIQFSDPNVLAQEPVYSFGGRLIFAGLSRKERVIGNAA